MTSLPDPFAGGPPKPPPQPKPVPPPVITIAALPPVSPVPDRLHRPRYDGTTLRIEQRPVPTLGRHAGWIFNSGSGQVVAIFEDQDGTSRTVRVGDQVGNQRVKAILPDALILVDQTGEEHRLPLQGLDTYSGKTRGVQVDVNPNMPMPWGGGR
jgi:hypothetical protein